MGKIHAGFYQTGLVKVEVSFIRFRRAEQDFAVSGDALIK